MATAVDEVKTDNDALHYLIISIYEVDKIESLIAMGVLNPNAEAMDLYCSITFDKKEMLQTRTFLRCKEGNLKIRQSKRFAFEKPEDMPQFIQFLVWDKDYDEVGAELASFDFDLRENLTANYSLHKTVKFNRSDATIFIGIDYQYATPSELEQQINLNNDNYATKIKTKLIQMHNAIDPAEITKLRTNALLKWFYTNTKLLFFLRKNWYNEVPLSIENFAAIVAPSYQLTERDYARYMAQYNAMCQLFEEGFNAYYDDEFDILYYDDDEVELGGHNVTGQIHELWRYLFLKDVLLKGQDAEFNIYRSYYFAPSPMKIPMALLALLVQIVLTVGITIYILEDVGRIFQGDLDIFIIVGSGLVFGFLSLISYSSASAFSKFYEHIHLVYAVPCFFIAVDYVSSVVMPIYITLVSLLFLMQSESYSDLMMTTMMMMMMMKMNHIVNVFESAKDALIIQDLEAMQGYKSPRKVRYDPQYIVRVILSPVFIFATIWISLKHFVRVCCCMNSKAAASKLEEQAGRQRVYSL